ncbi:copper chaperone PCu(A)C [Mycobacterium crocinum]|uniref:Copper chaperone PCu(A)C n=1 Tax=Mycolicibacterium crocinum TaxID=388459 RepID=A0ABY3TR15_9MYCO|nr:copper chaperone PCu(A)C [Mycolicibacterium crocinum]MCV7217540.1 copper chaperone PCu(A)C [Mycolicibacterium crocinum]ULN42419.1 copper chaperone PCu(A)C [Mycolicibacterium crocinum]
MADIRRIAATGTGLVLVVGTAACNSDRPMGSANRGSNTDPAATAVENAFIVPAFVPGACAIQVGKDAALNFTVTNNRTTGTESLSAVSTPAAQSVDIAPAMTRDIPAGQTISTDAAGPRAVMLRGVKADVRPATAVHVTFTFENAGQLRLVVPVDACPSQPAPLPSAR